MAVFSSVHEIPIQTLLPALLPASLLELSDQLTKRTGDPNGENINRYVQGMSS